MFNSQTEEKICVVCLKPFERFMLASKSGRPRKLRAIRPVGVITCKSLCSRLWSSLSKQQKTEFWAVYHQHIDRKKEHKKRKSFTLAEQRKGGIIAARQHRDVHGRFV